MIKQNAQKLFFREDNLGDMTVFGEFKHKQK
jgi:hypothetical protein